MASPETQAEPYLKVLSGWLATTRTLQKQRGMTILHYADGHFRTLINQLDVEQPTAENSGELVYNQIKETYEEYFDKPFGTAAENCLFGSDGTRRKGESLIEEVGNLNVRSKKFRRCCCARR